MSVLYEGAVVVGCKIAWGRDEECLSVAINADRARGDISPRHEQEISYVGDVPYSALSR